MMKGEFEMKERENETETTEFIHFLSNSSPPSSPPPHLSLSLPLSVFLSLSLSLRLSLGRRVFDQMLKL